MPASPSHKTDLLRGTLDLLILRTLALRPLHGVAIADRIAQLTQGTFHILPGTLFPALHRLEQAGWTAGEWTTTAVGRRIRSYALTPAGRKQLIAEEQTWERVVAAMTRVLRST